MTAMRYMTSIKNQIFYLLANMQDEVHRFAISYHKRLREKKFKESVLDEIDGIGFKRKQKLLHHFKTINKVKEATVDQLADVIGKKSGQAVYDFLERKKKMLKNNKYCFVDYWHIC